MELVPDLGEDMPPLSNLIGERELVFTPNDGGAPEKVKVNVYAPALKDQTWWCPYEIRATSFSRTYALAGEDSLQALLGALSILSTELEVMSRQHSGGLTHFGSEDLDLPTMDWMNTGLGRAR